MNEKSRAYWHERAMAADMRKESDLATGDARLLAALDSSRESIQSRLNDFYTRYGKDGTVSTTEARKTLTPKELDATRREFARLASQTQNEGTKAQLEKLRQRVKIGRQEALLAEVNYYSTLMTERYDEIMQGNLFDIYREAENHQWYDIEQAMGVQVNYENIAPSNVLALIHTGYDGRDYSDKIWYDRDTLIKNLNEMIPRGFILGTKTDEMAAELAKAMGTSYNNARRLLHTEAAYVASKGQIELYKATGIARYELLATLDNSTSEICQEMDGKDFAVTEAQVGITMPPFHPWCRTITIPSIDMTGFNETRAARTEGGQTYHIPKMTYRQWEQTKPQRQTQAKTAPAIVSEAKQRFDVDITLPVASNEYERTIKDIQESMREIEVAEPELFEEAIWHIKEISEIPENMRARFKNSYAYWHEGPNRLAFNPELFKGESLQALMDSYNNDVSKGFHPPGTDYRDIFTHELGHALDYSIGKYLLGKRGSYADKYMLQIAREYYRENKIDARKSWRVMAESISGYAAKSTEEAFAEAFADHIRNGRNARPASTYIVNFVKTRFLEGVKR